jgi:hypothetical protein
VIRRYETGESRLQPITWEDTHVEQVLRVRGVGTAEPRELRDDAASVNVQTFRRSATSDPTDPFPMRLLEVSFFRVSTSRLHS